MPDKENFSAEKSLMQKIIFIIEVVNVRLRFILILIFSGVLIGYWDTIMNYYEKYTRPKNVADTVLTSNVEYFCPMHPNVVRDISGACPICGMPLSQRNKSEAHDELPPDVLGRVQLSPYRIALAGIKTAEVEYFPLEKFIEVPGTVEFDERKLARISARTSGRIESLFANYTGTAVKQGDSLAKIYSPQLLASIDELLNITKSNKNIMQSMTGFEGTARVNQSLAESARKRLLYLGLTDSQLKEIERTGKTDSNVTIYSPLAGIVTKKYVVDGQYVDEGAPLFDVANLLVVWMQAKVYEEDIQYIKIGQQVLIKSQAYPNDIFYGNIAFADYVVDKNTRTVNVRVDIGNPDLKLKPGMFLNASIKVPISEIEPFKSASRKDEVTAAEKKAIYYCPMHPEIRSNKADATCLKCGGMKLVPMPAGEDKKIIYVCPMHPEVTSAEAGKCEKCKAFMDMDLEPKLVSGVTGEVLVVPETAVIDTGMKKIVYAERENGIFDALEVTLGLRSGGYYPVISGLKKGDKIAETGAFLIDAESRLNPVKRKTPPSGNFPAKETPPPAVHRH